MKEFLPFLYLALFVPLVSSNVMVQFEGPAEQVYIEGAKALFQFTVDKGAFFLNVQSNFSVVHLLPEGGERALYNRLQRGADCNPEHYSELKHEMGPSQSTFSFEILAVRPIDQGTMVARVMNEEGTYKDSVKIDVYEKPAPGDVTVNFANQKPRYLKVGDKDVGFRWSINRGVKYLAEATFSVGLQSRGKEETVLYTRQSPTQEAAERYSHMERIDSDGLTVFTFKLLEVSDKDEGTMIVRVSHDGMDYQDKQDLIIFREVEDLDMVLANGTALPPPSTRLSDGIYLVTCHARRCNPPVATMGVLLDNVLVNGTTETVDEGRAEMSYRTSLTVELDLRVGDNRTLECRAEQPSGGRTEGGKVQISRVVSLDVFSYDPKIRCTDGRSYPRMLNLKMKCVVDHTGLDIKSIRFNVINPEEGRDLEIVPGQWSVHYLKAELEKIDDTTTEAILTIEKTEKWHLASKYSIQVLTTNGRTTTHPLILNEIDYTPGSSDCVASSLAVCLVGYLLASLV